MFDAQLVDALSEGGGAETAKGIHEARPSDLSCCSYMGVGVLSKAADISLFHDSF